MQDELLAHVRSLESLGISGEKYGFFLTPVILSRLPQDIRMEWAREGEGKESDLDFLLQFLKRELQRRERSDVFRGVSSASRDSPSSETRYKSPPTVSALQAASKESHCGFCGKGHSSGKCWDVLRLSVNERHQAISRAKLCFRCLSSDHFAKKCRALCSYCRGKHHEMCCKSKWGAKDTGIYQPPTHSEAAVAKPQQSSVRSDLTPESVPFVPQVPMPSERARGPPDNAAVISPVNVSLHSKSHMYKVLQTAKVMVFGEKGAVEATLLFDSGSDRSYISSKLVQRVGPKWKSTESLSYSSFGVSVGSGETERNVYEVGLQGSKCSTGSSCILQAVEVPVICAQLSRPKVPHEFMQNLGPLQFADDYEDNRQVTIDILVGLDFYWSFVKQGMVRMSNGPVAQETHFGWVLSGSWLNKGGHQGYSASQLLCLNDIPEQALHKFWDLETVGIRSIEKPPVDNILERFSASVQFSDNRYTVALPWKSDVDRSRLLNNEALAMKRTDRQANRLSQDPKLEKQYNKALVEMEESGVIEEVPNSELVSPYPTYYMPHRPVVRDSSVSTKVRPVFDASAKGVNGVSLNDCLDEGPCLLPDLVSILLRFRRWQIALVSDITKAFLQINVQIEDRDAHRFFWKIGNNVRVMRFTRVPFGNCASPFLLNATVKHHLSRVPPSHTVDELRENLYVDDWLSGADKEGDAFAMFTEAQGIMASAGMHLSKWKTNSDLVANKIFKESSGKYLESESIKVLGLGWQASSDSFDFTGFEVPSDLYVTKRVVLSIIARMFDPLGFLTPFIMKAKIIFQQLWQSGVGWDELAPQELREDFLHWVEGLKSICHLCIERRYFGSYAWSSLQGLEVHAFGDASEKGYGTVVYLRIPVGNKYRMSFVMARSRVAPIKKVTLPRLELLGALLTARTVGFVMKALSLSVTYKCWTDSMVALSWIKGDPSKYKTFVGNRVREIHQIVDPSCWNHCPGKGNPADLITRGAFAHQLVKSKHWFEGPDWLQESEGTEREEAVLASASHPQSVKEMKTVKPHQDEEVSNPFDVKRWGTLTKAVRVVSFVLRFVDRLTHREIRAGCLINDELQRANTVLIKSVQREVYHSEIVALRSGKNVASGSSIAKLTPFLGKDDVLRVKGRLQLSDLSYDEKHPVILPKGYFSWLLIRSYHLKLKHAGVESLVSNLRNRYYVVGVRRLAKSVKRNCAPCQRAVHIELVDSLSVQDFLLSFRRFVARRGLPVVIYSDNAKTFAKGQTKLLELYGSECPTWKFIAPRAPWWGGWWEKLVGSVKSALKKSLTPAKTSISRPNQLRFSKPRQSCDPNKVYLIVGGLGGFGLELANWLVSRGCKKLVITTRSGIKHGYQSRCFHHWLSRSVVVELSRLDVSKLSDCNKVLRQCQNMGPIGGIFNLAMVRKSVLKDALLDNLTPADFQEVCKPKLEAALNLDQATRRLCGPELDWFVMFSSVSSGRGNAGQSNYGFANSAMERICEKRTEDQLPGTCL
ncbi:Fatty acid synthase [Holothuria leucospilota]|uniref:Fatty acid synthase n=1 Tax=Holothuria leucospilota TaxID=206669 RepID=A0A9Q1H1K2_HOLLE|nr:Fatty acid synthase [Holothuria leucospilota]